ncbi:MAG: hypothetical protein ACREFE_09400, partial [Limisphaerales bacterium]
WSGLNDSAGAATSATLTVSGVSDGWYGDSGDNACVNGTLMFDFWKSAGMTYVFSNLTANAYYDVYVYLENNYGGPYVGVNVNGGVTDYVNEYEGSFFCSRGLYTAVSTDPNYDAVANYLEFSTQAQADGTLTIAATCFNDKAGIAGIQIVPSTPVSIVTQPADETVYTNSSGNFTVKTANGEGALSYQWYSIIGGATNLIAGATNAIYVTPPTTDANNGDQYHIVVTDATGNMATSDAATLSVVDGTPNVVSIQFYSDHWGPVGQQPLLPGDVTGAFPVDNWTPCVVQFPNAYVVGGYIPNTFYGLQDLNGYGSPVNVTVLGVNDAWRDSDPAPDSAPITKLLNSYVKVSNGSGDNTLGSGMMQFVLTNLDNSKTYDVYVYVQNYPDVHPVVDAGNGVTYYSGPEMSTVNQNSTFVGCYNTDPNNPSVTSDPANFIQITNITPVNGAVTVTVQYNTSLDASAGGNLGVSGLQVVESSLDAYPPTIQTQPASVGPVYTNVPVTFSVSALGLPTPTVQWYEIVGGVTNLIDGATEYSYTVDTTLDMDGDQFFAEISNPSGATNSATATLNVVAGTPTGVWSVKTDPEEGGYTPLVPTDATGAFLETNWETASVSPGGGDQTFSLNDSAGIGTAVQLTVIGCSDGWRLNDPPPDNAPITKLMNTFLKYGYGYPYNPANELGAGTMQLVLTNLDDSQTYDVYVYFEDDWAGSGSPDYADVDGGNGVINYVGPSFPNVNQYSNFVESVSTDPADVLAGKTQGNYVHLAGIQSSGGVATITVNYDQNSQAYSLGVCGFQLLDQSLDLTPIAIQTQPASQRVLTNTPATFTVSASGFPLNPQWYEVSGGVTNLIAGATNASYTTLPVQDSDTGTGYFVVVSNSVSGDITSSVAVLTAGHIIGPIAGFLESDEYFGISSSGSLVSQLYPNSTFFTSTPANRSAWLTSFTGNADFPADAAERIYGWFTPAVSGDYVFYVATSDSSALYLSTDTNAANAYEIAQNQAWMAPEDWTLSNTNVGEGTYYSYGEWRSDLFESGGGPNAFDPYGWSPWPTFNSGDNGIPLVAGTKYYIELDHWAANGSGNASVAGVTYKLAGNPDPNPGDASLLAGANLSTMSAMDGSAISITNQPANATVQAGNTATFKVGAISYVEGAPTAPAPMIEYQWYVISGGVTNAIAGATGASYTTAATTSGDSGDQFYCMVSTIGFQTNSNLATLTVGAPQPRIVSISLSGGDLVISGTNGSSSGTYYVLTSTNVALPLNQWTPILTNTFDSGGNFSVTNSVTGSSPQQFYLLQVP